MHLCEIIWLLIFCPHSSEANLWLPSLFSDKFMTVKVLPKDSRNANTKIRAQSPKTRSNLDTSVQSWREYEDRFQTRATTQSLKLGWDKRCSGSKTQEVEGEYLYETGGSISRTQSDNQTDGRDDSTERQRHANNTNDATQPNFTDLDLCVLAK